MFTITSAAADTSLASIEAMRVAAGLSSSDDSRDDELELLGLAVAADIVTACRVAIGNGAPPTLRQETILETIQPAQGSRLLLSRRHEVEILSIVADDEELAAETYAVSEEAGILSRFVDGWPMDWRSRTVSIVYKAGFAEVPPDLAQVAVDLARIRLSGAARDPLVRGESTEVPGVLTERTDFWVGATPGTSKGPVPTDIARRLTRYFNVRSW